MVDLQCPLVDTMYIESTHRREAEMTMNTAKMREKARLYESKLDWEKAAICWDEAIKLYPKPYPQHGALALADIANMQAQAKSCRNMIEHSN